MEKIGQFLLLCVFALLFSGCADEMDTQIKQYTQRMEKKLMKSGPNIGNIGNDENLIFIGSNQLTLTLNNMLANYCMYVEKKIRWGWLYACEKKKVYTSKEQLLDVCVAWAQISNIDLGIYTKGLAKKVTDAEKKIVDLKKNQKNAKTRQAKLQEKQAEVNKILYLTNDKIEREKIELQLQLYLTQEATKSQNSVHATTMNGEVEDLKNNIEQLEKLKKSLVSFSASKADN